jgi:glutaredoxin
MRIILELMLEKWASYKWTFWPTFHIRIYPLYKIVTIWNKVTGLAVLNIHVSLSEIYFWKHSLQSFRNEEYEHNKIVSPYIFINNFGMITHNNFLK